MFNVPGHTQVHGALAYTPRTDPEPVHSVCMHCTDTCSMHIDALHIATTTFSTTLVCLQLRLR